MRRKRVEEMKKETEPGKPVTVRDSDIDGLPKKE